MVADHRFRLDLGIQYRNVRYTSGGEEATGALKSITKNIGNEREVFLKANSAGAVHLMMFLFVTSFVDVCWYDRCWSSSRLHLNVINSV